MSKKFAPRVQLNFAPEEEDILPDEELLDSPQDLAEHAGDLPCEMPEVIERDEIVENDIFDSINTSLNGSERGSEAKEDIVIEEEEPPPPPATRSSKPKPTQSSKTEPQAKQTQQKKKRQLSEEHKAKLALAREKALVTRRKKAEEKKKMKEIENKTKELKKKKAQKDLEELEDEVIHDKPSKPTIVNQGPMFTKEDLENAQLDAIMKYEAIRKTRKEEKRKVQMIEQQKKDLQKKIQGYGARDTNGRLVNKWDRCY
tara:strand:+ start:814 stop:1584 length:771 start_codon:yes stop_codon:yes gene_type:complete